MVGLHLRSSMNPPFHPQSIYPSANLPSFHLPHTETHPWGPHPPSVSEQIMPFPGQPYHTGAPVSVFVHFSPIIHYLLYKRLYFQSLHYLFVVTFGDLLPFFGQSQPMSPLVGALLIIHPCRHHPYLQSTPQATYLCPLNLFTLSRLWHNLSPVLSSP
jgi:hypothetical protein